MVLLDRHVQPSKFCADPGCEWAHLPHGEHFDRHNPPCAEHFVATDSSEFLCELVRGHEGPHRGARLASLD